MNSSGDARNPVELLAEEFLDRRRRGERPTLREYTERHPELADEIRDLFPALLMVEDLGEGSAATTGSLAADHVAAIGARLDRLGDYRILREIGRGGMGVVYEAEQESLGRRVALKVLSAGSLPDPKQVRRFEREAKAAARLHHTNIVPVFGVGRQEGHHYFVMQFIAGLGLDAVLDDLRRLRRARSGGSPSAAPSAAASRVAGLAAAEVARSLIAGRFVTDATPAAGLMTEPVDDSGPDAAGRPPADPGPSPAVLPGSSELSASSDPDRPFYRSAARIGIQVAEALEYANRQGILHRDVKPSNLLLDNHGNVWVADFGLAKTAEADDLSHTGDILGTIRYMAPERFAGHCDARSDVYSLGLTLYELVALRPAYEASDRHTLIDRVLHEEPERLRKLAPGVPRDLETIIAKAMARDPAGRYATAAALADDLRRFVEDRPIRARRTSAIERAWRWCRRNPWLASSTAAATAAVVIALVLALDRARRQAEANQQIAGLARDLQKESGDLKEQRARLETSLAESNRRMAMLNFERGRAACELGQIGPGMLWFVESLRAATDAGDPAWKRLALANLSAWRRWYLEPRAVFSHGDEIIAVAFSPDGKTVLTGSHDDTARLWDAATGRPIGPPMDHQDDLRALAFSPDGRTVATVSVDGTARLWNAATGRPIGHPMVHHGVVDSVAFSPNGRTILTGCVDATVRRWDAASGRPIGQPMKHSGWVTSIAYSPGGKTFLTVSDDNTARLWDAANDRPLGGPLDRPGAVNAAIFSPDGKSILTRDVGRTARLWEASTGRPIGRPMEHPDLIYAAAFSPDGKTILTGSRDKAASLWDATTCLPVGKPMEHPDGVYRVAYSPDGRTILTVSLDRTARLWDAATCQPVGRPLEHQGWIMAAAFSPDGKTILTGSKDGTARLWDAVIGRPVGRPLEHQGTAGIASFSPDSKTVLTGVGYDMPARLWDAASGQPMGQPMVNQGVTRRARFSPDGRTILTASDDRTARLWDAATGRRIGQPMPHQGEIRAAAFSPDGKAVLTGSDDRTARLWDASTGRSIGRAMVHQGPLLGAAFSPDGKAVLTGSRDGMARLWDANSGRPIGRPMIHRGGAWVVAFGPDGRTVATAGADSTVRLWDATTGQPIGEPMAHPSGVRAVSFSPDGRTILTRDTQFSMRLWDAGSGRLIGQPVRRSSGSSHVGFSPDGRTVLTYGNRSRLWDAASGRPISRPLEHQGPVMAIDFSPGGQTVLTGSADTTAQLWDVATGRPVGPRWGHSRRVYCVACSPDGKTFLTAAWDDVTRLWDAPRPLPDDLERLSAWVEATTGLGLDEQGAVRVLDNEGWHRRRERLAELGGSPPDPAPLLDPILFGPDPAARGDAWEERGRWDRAEADYAEALRARPLNGAVRDALVRLHARRGHLDRAAATLAEAVRLMPEDPQLRGRFGLVLLGSGDRAGWRRSCAALLDRSGGPTDSLAANLIAWAPALGSGAAVDPVASVRLAEAAVRGGVLLWSGDRAGWRRAGALFGRSGGPTDPMMANLVARACVLGPGAVADPGMPVRLAEAAVRGAGESSKMIALNTLGAALYRAARYDEAIRRLEEVVRLRGGAGLPEDWAFLAMAHHRLGHRDEARRWLDRLREYPPTEEPARFWDDLEIRLLRSEAEAVILFDPAFPDDPFAH